MYCRRVIDIVNPELAATLLVLLSAIYMPFKVLVMYMLDLIHERCNKNPVYTVYCRTVSLALVTSYKIAYFC